MIPYWILFLIPAYLAMTRLQPVLEAPKRWSNEWQLTFGLLVLMVGLRHQVGGDWFTYIEHLRMVTGVAFEAAIIQGDPAYVLINWLVAKAGYDVYLTNTVCAMIFAWGLLVFCRAQPRPWLALTVAMPYLVTVVAMGYTRQGVAIGLVMVALVALSERNILRFVLLVVLAATFHKSAVILIPLAVLSGTKRKLWTAAWVAVFAVFFYGLMLQDHVDGLKSGYLEAKYQSSGATIRIAMNAVPAVLFLWFRDKFEMPKADRVFWTWMSIMSLGFIVALKLSSSSTAVDRVALYWIPLQLFVLSRLPNAVGRPEGRNAALVNSVVIYSAVILFVWLFYAQTAFAWLPYNNLIWSW